jgi:hypothetical protein
MEAGIELECKIQVQTQEFAVIMENMRTACRSGIYIENKDLITLRTQYCLFLMLL